MTLQIADRVKETTTTTGTGALSLAGAVTGFRAFSAICANGDTCWYALQAVDSSGNPTGDWEVGLGTYNTSGNTLSRTTVFASSNSGSLVSLAAGTTQIWLDYPASMVPNPAHIIVGQSGQSDTELPNRVIIPGLSASPDIRVAGTNDDEFDAALSGWTTFNSPTVANSNTDAKSHLHIKLNAPGSAGIAGVYKAVPTIPFTVTCKVSDAYIRGSYNRAGIFLTNSAATTLFEALAFGTTDTDGTANLTGVEALAYTALNSSSGRKILTGGHTNGYLRMVVNSSTSVDEYFSVNGLIWRLVTNVNPGFTVANVGMFVDSANATYPGEAYFDWIRFT